ncbi:prolyl oligopeptidase family serine peptidase [Horticoccus luteus]|uniref:Prolyl oligopeptidase family serine peptidase n=1 Tax=Horticoccus luteus TaxID=2862869 RepID=A0A8F9XLX3_9BACT|nr:prolyl oligopeptidase family serine peptidase [Horticoccus luteus]QYM79464.1 prolyl oligopeptidase family serine peptidase [Horticoccus luteus]
MRISCGRGWAIVAVAALMVTQGMATEAPGAQTGDAYGWLEQIDSPRSLAWVQKQNERTAQHLTQDPLYADLYRDALAALNSPARLPEVDQRGNYVYNFWQDAAHPRGIYRRATLDAFRQPEPRWETVLDIDALAKSEGKPWALGGVVWLPPENERCLIALSPGGGDAAEWREFDAGTCAFVTDGFRLPVAKSRVNWRDRDALYVATDFGAGSLSASGYPLIVKLWRRGTPLSQAATVHKGAATSLSATARRLSTPAGDIDVVAEQLTFWTTKHWQLIGGQLVPLALPATADVVDGYHGALVVVLKEDWTVAGVTHRSGSVVLVAPAAVRGGDGRVEDIVAPSEQEVVKGVAVTPQQVWVTMLDNVRGRLYRFTRGSTEWTREAIPFPDNGALKVTSTDDTTGDAWVVYESFLTPPTLYYVGHQASQPVKVKAEAPTFDASGFEVQQHWTQSADGTRIPYFVVGKKGFARDGKNPVWMFSYGGFEIALTPSYSGSYEALHGAYGKMWLERGGVFVLANIRGGGEFGPTWHRAAMKENHYKAFEDFEAVARAIEATKITSPAHLGIEGRSNGGLLVSATMLRHPELYGAVVCGNPLVDMRRYQKLLAGASWMGEYGDPDVPAEWAYISKYSPYENVRPGMKLPPIMFYTSTRDDRVHPGHARKMAAKMEAMGYAVEYYENTEGGHHGSVTHEQLATRLARTYTFLWEHVK